MTTEASAKIDVEANADPPTATVVTGYIKRWRDTHVDLQDQTAVIGMVSVPPGVGTMKARGGEKA